MLGRPEQACPTPDWEEDSCELASVGKDIPKCLFQMPKCLAFLFF